MADKQGVDEAIQGLRELALFAGGGGGIIGGKLLGWRTVCAVEIDPYAAGVLVARQNDGNLEPFPVWDDITDFDGRPWRGLVDVVSGGFPCFVEGTQILTWRGYLPIEQVEVGDRVLTHRGRWRRITSVMSRDNAPVREIRGTGFLPTKTTDEHPYLARFRKVGYDSEKRRGVRKFENPEWVEASKLEAGHFTVQVLPEERTSVKTEGFWWLVGRYLADGWRVERKGRDVGRVVICCAHKEAEVLSQRIQESGFNATRTDERTVCKFHITQGSFYKFLRPFGKGAAGKRLPGCVHHLPSAESAALFEGWMSGDGCRLEEGKLWKATTVSPALALGMALVAQRAYGRVANIYRVDVPKRTRIEGRVVNQSTQYQLVLCDSNRSSFVEGACGWKIVRKNTPAGRARVYNVSVEEDESYVANGCVVHNCQDISCAGKGGGIEAERSGLWREMARIVREVRPRYVFVENSPMLVSRGLGTVLGDLAAMGYDARWGVLGAHHAGAPHKRDRIWILAHLGEV